VEAEILGIRIDTLTAEDASDRIAAWIDARARGHYVTLTNVHMIVEARQSAEFRSILREASLCLPDGMPLVWIARAHGQGADRISGPDFMIDFCERTAHKRYRHFFYGGAAAVAQQLAVSLKQMLPELEVAGWMSPPFRQLTPEEDEEIVQQINRAQPDVLWVALGCPKQETWMHAHRGRISAPVMLGVGQAFNVHTGRLPRAPKWMRESGLEWLFRLSVEPRRLWRRYLFTNASFVASLFAEVLGLKHFD
jgi:N-acetylglucosaminyldiphosphoundecaprenol N-acetyl-beta-D-mannosaminyltransferase